MVAGFVDIGLLDCQWPADLVQDRCLHLSFAPPSGQSTPADAGPRGTRRRGSRPSEILEGIRVTRDRLRPLPLSLEPHEVDRGR